jgi:hypothetical protein
MSSRRDSRPKIKLQDRLSAWASELRRQAARLPPGSERDELLKDAGRADTLPIWTIG